MQKIFNFLSSAKLAIVLFLVLAFISIFGTIIPQGEPPQFYLMKYGSFFGKLILQLKLYDAYHSWWYVGTLFFFLANLIACSIKRFPVSWNLYKKNPADINPQNLPNNYQVTLKSKFSSIADIVSNKFGFKKAEKTFQNGTLFYKDINRWSHLSVYVVHFSIIVIIIGALIGAIWGYRGNMAILEGESSNIVLPFGKKDPVFLDFFVKLNKFTLELYPDGTPKEYISNITVIDKNKTFNTRIKVNAPFKYKGLSFYQASYQFVPEFRIRVIENGKENFYTLNSFIPLVIDDKYTITLKDFGQMQRMFYAKIVFFDIKNNRNIPGIIVQNFPHFRIPIENGMLQIILDGIEKVRYISVFQVKKDPGVGIVYAGFLMILLGLIGVYFFEPKTFWIFVDTSQKEKISLRIGAYAKRERDTLRLKLEEIANKIKNIDFS